VLLILLLLGDFTYRPPAGRWLDYARSRQLSASRHLIVEQTGTVGDYSAGAAQKVFDSSGRFLYNIEATRTAWFVSNGIQGSEDTYIYQNHPTDAVPNQPFHLWHPQYGDRIIKFQGKDLAHKRETRNILTLNQGKRIVVFSTSYEAIDSQPTHHMEAIDLKGTLQELFSAVELPIDSYIDAKVNVLDFFVEGRFAYFHDGVHGRYIQEMDLTAIGRDAHMKELETALLVRWFNIAHGYIAYDSLWIESNPEAEMDYSTARVLEGVDAEIPIFILTESDKTKFGYDDLLTFFGAFNSRRVHREGNMLYAKHTDRFFIFDTENKLLSVYRAEVLETETKIYGSKYTKVTDDASLVVDRSQYAFKNKISPLQAFQTSRPELLRVIDVNNFHKDLPKPTTGQ
jgi:hypothetical protein